MDFNHTIIFYDSFIFFFSTSHFECFRQLWSNEKRSSVQKRDVQILANSWKSVSHIPYRNWWNFKMSIWMHCSLLLVQLLPRNLFPLMSFSVASHSTLFNCTCWFLAFDTIRVRLTSSKLSDFNISLQFNHFFVSLALIMYLKHNLLCLLPHMKNWIEDFKIGCNDLLFTVDCWFIKKALSNSLWEYRYSLADCTGFIMQDCQNIYKWR